MDYVKSPRLWHRLWRFCVHSFFAFMVINGVISVWEVSAQTGPQAEPDFWKVLALVGFGLIGTGIFGLYSIVYRQGKELTKLTGRVDGLCLSPGKPCSHHEAVQQSVDKVVSDFGAHEKAHNQQIQKDIDRLRDSLDK